ncbi:ABC transporter ATP-binding protein [Cohnella pontilimi]|uniref:ABC transporter ATP-binding protein n=1 Tax=Cohnella pontilimi TaxID=2564100 RepID=A0A4U0FAU0_9BACL|nr:ABC transporter ATP-binding protein [Cohnella pontilimi]TJY41771.1 ABC transporter ATP-binding protein [Cohnella pontilimi]
MKKPIIEFEDFSFQYRAQASPTLQGIDLTIYEGEKVLILGPSGSGKSTLAHCINGLIPFFYPGTIKGSLRIRGIQQVDLSIAELSEVVGTVLQDPDGQFIGLTVAEDIAFKLENKNVPQQEMTDKVAAAAEAVGIEAHLQWSPHNLSGGQKQRTTLGGVLVDDVDILLFDEPLANLDPKTGKSAIELIDRIGCRPDKTVIVIEHRLEDVLHRPVDRIIVMHEGRIKADLTPGELLSSEILAETGIREPLYVTALKYAGCRITPDQHPEHVDTIRLDESIAKLRTWYESQVREMSPVERETVLELEHVDFGYEENRLILQDISLRIGQGEMVSIVGKNGAGKSTLSKLICGFHYPGKGRILFKGHDMRGDTIKERSRYIGYVMQNPNQMISKSTVYEETAFGLSVRKIPEEEMKVRVYEVLRICGLYEFRNWPISALSFGQKKRVTIASILVMNPEILILDEPTAGQDYRHYNEMMEFLLQLNHGGITVIMITHDMHLMMEYAHRTIVLADGRKIADDRPSAILTDPAIVETANLKETSVYQLARRAGFDEPQEFVRRFIEYDRRKRAR